ncbi:MAG: hypothetical protein M1587_02715 [Thaumarchaeota archaeon]|nr:hypothetical protein [Nitrososphaerota archaeon]
MSLIHALLSLPTWQPGNPSYAATYLAAVMLAFIILGLSLAASLRNRKFRGNKAS